MISIYFILSCNLLIIFYDWTSDYGVLVSYMIYDYIIIYLWVKYMTGSRGFSPVFIKCGKYIHTFHKTARILSSSCISRTRCCPVFCGAPRASIFWSGCPLHSCGWSRRRLRRIWIYREARERVSAILKRILLGSSRIFASSREGYRESWRTTRSDLTSANRDEHSNGGGCGTRCRFSEMFGARLSRNDSSIQMAANFEVCVSTASTNNIFVLCTTALLFISSENGTSVVDDMLSRNNILWMTLRRENKDSIYWVSMWGWKEYA